MPLSWSPPPWKPPYLSCTTLLFWCSRSCLLSGRWQRAKEVTASLELAPCENTATAGAIDWRTAHSVAADAARVPLLPSQRLCRTFCSKRLRGIQLTKTLLSCWEAWRETLAVCIKLLLAWLTQQLRGSLFTRREPHFHRLHRDPFAGKYMGLDSSRSDYVSKSQQKFGGGSVLKTWKLGNFTPPWMSGCVKSTFRDLHNDYILRIIQQSLSWRSFRWEMWRSVITLTLSVYGYVWSECCSLVGMQMEQMDIWRRKFGLYPVKKTCKLV